MTSIIRPLSSFAEYDYIKSMLDDIEINRQKYEPKSPTMMTVEESDCKTEEEYQNYVEKYYTYFRNIIQHYKNLDLCRPLTV